MSGDAVWAHWHSMLPECEAEALEFEFHPSASSLVAKFDKASRPR
jgi:hypothetical protein